MSDTNLLLNLVLAWIVPPVTELINTKLTVDWHKKAAALLVSLAVGAIATVPQMMQTGSFTWENLLTNIGVVVAAGQTYYSIIWKKSAAQKTLQNL